MKKYYLPLLFALLIFAMTGCNKTTTFEETTATTDTTINLNDIEYDSYNVMEETINMNLEMYEMEVAVNTYFTESVFKAESSFTFTFMGETLTEETVIYSEMIDQGIRLYTENPYQDGQYIATVVASIGENDEVNLDFILDNISLFEWTDDGNLYHEFKFQDLTDFLGSSFDSITDSLSVDIGSSINMSSIGIELVMDGNLIKGIEMDLDHFVESLIDDMCNDLGCSLDDFTELSGDVTIALKNENVNITLPEDVIYDDFADTMSEDIPAISLSEKIYGRSDYYMDVDVFKLVIASDGYYLMDFDEDINLVYFVNSEDDDYLFYEENLAYQNTPLNQRTLEMEAGTYYISVYSTNEENMDYSLEVMPVDAPVADDLSNELAYSSSEDVTWDDYGNYTVECDYLGDVDTVYLPISMSYILVTLPKDISIINLQYGNVQYFLPFDDFNAYILVHQSGGVYTETWSFSLIHDTASDSGQISIIDVRAYPDDALEYVGNLEIGTENFLHNFYTKTYLLTVNEEGDYEFNFEVAPETAEFGVDIFTIDDNYVMSIFDSGEMVYLTPGTYVVNIQTNAAQVGIFKLIIIEHAS